VIRDADGNLYGTTFYGGTTCGAGCGVVFEIDAAGVFKVLHSFVRADGAYPNAGLIRDSAGNLYGNASEGGTGGAGVVYELDQAGGFIVLHDFIGTDGSQPWGGLTLDSAGNLYGTTQNGGGHGCGGVGCGVVFELSPPGTLKVLYSFTGGFDGGQPYAGLVRDHSGNIYGTNGIGAGAGCGGIGCGVIYGLDLNNGEFTVLHRFTGEADGGDPQDALLLQAGYLYGTAYYGGSLYGGVVFKVRKTPPGQ
jgi:uncharacterized repeat protein (TIGR03803 family)